MVTDKLQLNLNAINASYDQLSVFMLHVTVNSQQQVTFNTMSQE
jgi:hypothetical protein